MTKQPDEEWEEVHFRIKKHVLDDALRYLSLERLTGDLYPEGNATQRLALAVMFATGRIKQDKDKS